jgi:hypothetical protein
MVHTIQNFKTSNLYPGFKFQQLLVPLKHVINLVMRIRDTGCHNKANSKEGEMVLVGLASWPPTRALVIKALLVKEAS